ncbi:hypothetical protein LAZ67_17000179 [Cordylochernes scorpioides]|uniref:Uncharacterized protein n=1 Tax=Cordylochernes scorpioides TaxID=51811 RepID=A0ABY6LG78_9ARAC|nr:hypothetical protein LAZ67_17000179 [Cordylochernes scorpioides]
MVELSELSYYRYCRITCCNCGHPGVLIPVWRHCVLPANRYSCLVLPHCPGANVDLVLDRDLGAILKHFLQERKPICAIGMGVAGLLSAMEDSSTWCFRKFSLTSVTGRTCVKDDLHTGRPLSIRNPENALKIGSSIKENPRITIRELSEDFDISFGTCQTIIKNDLHLKRNMQKHDPHWLKNVITGDEAWVYGYDPETKRQLSQWLEPGEPRFKESKDDQIESRKVFKGRRFDSIPEIRRIPRIF